MNISISNFPRDKIYVLLDKDYRKKLITNSMNKLACKNYFELSLWINKILKTKFNGGDIKHWIEGKRLDKRTGKIRMRNYKSRHKGFRGSKSHKGH